MATIQIREDSGENVQQKRAVVHRSVKLQAGQKELRIPLRCVSNAGAGGKENNSEAIEKRSKKELKESSLQNAESKISTVNLDCLKLIGKENVPLSEIYFDECQRYASDDILCNIEYGSDIWKYLCQREISLNLIKPNYMSKQKNITPDMRSVLVDWLVMVAEEYKLSEQTIHLCVNYIDRFLSYMSVVREKFQLVGAAAMMLAIKVEEVDILEPEEWVYLTGQSYTTDQIIRMEKLMLKLLNFEVNPPTAVGFIHQLCIAHCLDKQTLNMAMYLSELVLLEGGPYLQYLPSRLAAASIVLARCILNKQNPFYNKLEAFSGYNLEQLSPVIRRQSITYRESPTKAQQAIQDKYKSKKYCEVAKFTPMTLEF